MAMWFRTIYDGIVFDLDALSWGSSYVDRVFVSISVSSRSGSQVSIHPSVVAVWPRDLIIDDDDHDGMIEFKFGRRE